MLYWAHSAMEDGRCPLLIFGCICEEWFHHDHPGIDFGHYFAIPIRFTSTSHATIFGILEAHRSLCDQAPLLLGKIERGQVEKLYMSVWPKIDTSSFSHYAGLSLSFLTKVLWKKMWIVMD